MGFKIFFSFLSIAVVFIISSITFSNVQKNTTILEVKDFTNTNGLFNVKNDESSKYIEDKGFNSGALFSYERFNYLDSIFFDNENSYKINSTQTSEDIVISKGKYFMDFGLSKKYEISGTGFNIGLVGPAKIYIDTENSNKVTILSFDSVLNIGLLGLDDGKEKTKVYLYPHSLLSFKPHLNKILNNADLLRLSQINSINYIKDALYLNEINHEIYSEINNDFLKNILIYGLNDYKNYLADKKNIEKKFDLSVYDNFKKYFTFFINKDKKVAYYKDLIYINLIKVSTENNFSDSMFTDTISYFEGLKALDQKSYEDMINYLVYFKEKSLHNYNISAKNVDKKLKYDEMYSNIFGFQYIEPNYVLSSIFNSYDLGENEDFLNGLTSFSKDYLGSNGLKITTDKVSGYKDSKNIELSYYTVFLENVIKSNLLTTVNLVDIKYIFDIFNKYSLLSTEIYYSLEENKRKTLVVLHLDLLKNLDLFLRNVFFEKDLKNGNLLEKRRGFETDNKDILLFENSFNNLVNFFNENKGLFNIELEKDKLYVEDYNAIISGFGDYISALKDYQNYELKKNELWNTKTIGIDDGKIVYDLNIVNRYVSEFNGLNNDSYKITTIDNKVFNVKLVIGGKTIVFDLYPYDNFYLRNLYLDGIKRGDLTYNLSDIKKNMDEKYSKANTTDDKDKYNFANFFINTFLNVDTGELVVIDDSKPEDTFKEDTYILVFKRDKLLGSKGEFNILKDFTKINSEDIIITNNGGKYDIKLKDAEIFFTYQNNNVTTTNGTYLNSDYVFNETSHYFDNIKLKLYKNTQVNNGIDENFGLGDNEVTVIGKIDIRDIKNYMYDILKYYDSIVVVNNLLSMKAQKIYISIDKNKNIKYSFIYNSKNFEFYLNKDNIVSIKVGFNEKIKSPFNYSSLQDYINLLVK